VDWERAFEELLFARLALDRCLSAITFAIRKSGRAFFATRLRTTVGTGWVVMLTNFFLHLHPVSRSNSRDRLSYTWCMGGITFFLFLVETITGVLLMF